MLENLFTNVFGRPKSKSSGRNSQHDPTTSSGQQATSGVPHMTGPFSTSAHRMPQPPTLPYPIAPYPTGVHHPQPAANYYPSLPFNQPSATPGDYGSASNANHAQPNSYPTGTLASQISPLDLVPFEAKPTLNHLASSQLNSLIEVLREVEQAFVVVERVDAYLKSSQSDYDFKTEQGLIYQ